MYRKYVYNINACTITIDGENYAIDKSNFYKLSITHKYITQKVPYILLEVKLTKHMAKKAQGAKDVKVKLDILQIKKDENNKVLEKTPIIRKSFQAQITNDLESFTVNKHDTDKNQYGDNMNLELMTEFILYNTEDINFFDIEKEYLLSNCTPGTAMTLMLLDRDITKNVIASVPVVKTASDITIPLGNLMTNLRSLFVYNGLYRAFPIVYKDIDNLLIVDKYQLPIHIGNSKDVIKIVPSTTGKFDETSVDLDSNINFVSVYYPADTIIKPIINNEFIKMQENSNIIAVDSNGKVAKSSGDNIAKAQVVRNMNPLSMESASSYKGFYKTYDISIPFAPYTLFKPYHKYLVDKDTTPCLLFESVFMIAMGKENQLESEMILHLEAILDK